MIPLQHAPYQTRPGEWGSGFLKFRIPKKQYFRSTVTSNSLIRKARQKQRNKFQLLNALPTLGLFLNNTGWLFAPTRKGYSTNTYTKCDTPFKTEIGATQLRSVTANRAVEITVLMCEQKPYPVVFSCRRKSYPVQYEHSL